MPTRSGFGWTVAMSINLPLSLHAPRMPPGFPASNPLSAYGEGEPERACCARLLPLCLMPYAAGLAGLEGDGMPAELVAQRRDHLRRERFILARDEALQERERDHRRRHVLVYGGLHGPAPLAGVLDVAANLLQRRVFGEGERGQIQQPGAHDAAVLPDARHLAQIGLELRLLDDLEALAVRLEHAVLDAVVNHLDEVAGAAGAHVAIAVLRRERLEDRLAVLEGLALATDHQAVADLEAPDATARAHVQEVQAGVFHLFGVPDGILPVGVATVNDDVAGLEQVHHVMDGIVRHLAGRHHQPDDLRAGLQRLHQLVEGVSRNGALPRRLIH